MNNSKKKSGVKNKSVITARYDKKLDTYAGKVLPSAKLEKVNGLLANSDIKSLLAE